MDAPLANGSNGRDGLGRFSKGNPGGPGNPLARRASQIRTAIYDTVTDEDLRAVIAALVKKAKAGELAAIRELLDRLNVRAIEYEPLATCERAEPEFHSPEQDQYTLGVLRRLGIVNCVAE